MHGISGGACRYDRSRIKRGDIFPRNIRPREIEAESDKPAGDIPLAFFIILQVTRIRRTYPAFYQQGYGTRFSFVLPLSSSLYASLSFYFSLISICPPFFFSVRLYVAFNSFLSFARIMRPQETQTLAFVCRLAT